ncbi:MAG TPA: molybdenum cofactor cytidylyltransferase [Dehalococcoidales bacterium]|nr:molybdenum cofactor cytidylyltransferase [Dehalococcoidales bacterium]
MEDGPVSAILLAAGKSSRMGKLKQLMPLGDSTILEQTLANLLGSRATEVVVVLGHKAEEVVKRLSGRPVKVVVNPLYRKGMGSSIAAGLKFVDSQAQAVMLVLGDQPYVDSPTMNRLIDAFGGAKKGIVIPTYNGQRGHPLIFARKYQAQLSRLSGDIGGREIIREHPEDVLEVPVDCEGIIIDIDTPPPASP